MADVRVIQQPVEVAQPWISDVHVAQQPLETVVRPVPFVRLNQSMAEVAVRPVPRVRLNQQAIEVIWREADGIPVMPFRHNWESTLTERLEWKTDVQTMRSGLEARFALRHLPRRSLTLTLLVGAPGAAMGLVDWLADHQGRAAWWPLPQHGRTLKNDVPAESPGAFLQIDQANPLLFGAMQPDAPPAMDASGVEIFPSGSGRVLLVEPAGGWQVAEVGVDIPGGALILHAPLARPAVAGMRIIPLVKGVLRQAVNAMHHTDSIFGATLDIDLAAPHYTNPYSSSWAEGTRHAPAAMLDGLYVMPRGDFAGHEMELSAAQEVLDNAIAPRWSHRYNSAAGLTFARRFWAQGPAEIMALCGLVDHFQGRFAGCWLPEKISGLTLSEPAPAGADRLIIHRCELPAWITRAGALLIDGDGADPIALRTGSVATRPDGLTAILYLAAPLPRDVRKTARLTRLQSARLNHDAVDLVWHTNEIVEVNLTFAAMLWQPPIKIKGGV